MRGITALLLLSGFLLAFHDGRMAAASDWYTDLMANIERMNQKLQVDLQRTAQEIQQNVNNQVAQINANVNEQVARANENIAEALKNADKAGIHSKLSSVRLGADDSSIIINGNAGTSRTVHSGTNRNGQPYYVESENLVVGDTLFHTDRVYNYTTKKLDEQRYTLNLSDPNAKPVYLNVTKLP